PLVEVSDNSLRTQIVDAALAEIGAGHYQDLSIDRIVDRVEGRAPLSTAWCRVGTKPSWICVPSEKHRASIRR
ncbi:MAG: hypothetical protein WCG62_04190, partial [Actinomycetes bacterium]